MSAELFHVIACIIRRLTRNGQRAVPLATRDDIHERITTDPQPFLFQRHIGQRNEVQTQNAANTMLAGVCDKITAEHPEFAGRRFSPHDFRRMFATDLVNNGLPIRGCTNNGVTPEE
jgi:integrase